MNSKKFHILYVKHIILSSDLLIPLTLKRLGYFGSWKNWEGGAPLDISAVDRAITAKICTMVVCDLIYKIVFLDFPK